jgi:hypothetical protein
MRCPECHHNQRYRDGMRCNHCGYQFVLRRQDNDLTDNILCSIINRLSNNGQYYFTRIQLALAIAEYWRARKSSFGIGCFIVFLIGPLITACFYISNLFISTALLVIVIAFIIVWSRRSDRQVSFSKALAIIRRYHAAHPIAGLVEGSLFESGTRSYGAIEEFAPERILIVEYDDLVDMLVRNHFHLQTKTVVLSRSGYPARIFTACQTFLRNHPGTPVQCIHDASVQGFAMSATLCQDHRWRFACNNLVDLGLSSRSIARGKRRLPWVMEGRRGNIIFTRDYVKMLASGARLPIDFLPPMLFLSTLSAGVLSSVLHIPALEQQGGGLVGGDGDDYG